jgi:ComF family protein
MYGFIKEVFLQIFNYLLPPTCLNCSAVVSQNGRLCAKCFSKINFIDGSVCDVCGAPFELEEEEQTICAACLKKMPKYDKSRSAVVYDVFSKDMILNFKYKDRTEAAPYFADWLLRAGKVFFENEKIDFIVPVPLHRFRFWKRKFNQAALLSKMVAKKTGIKVNYDDLQRVKNTVPQAKLGRSQRKNNIKGAFRVRQKAKIKDMNILIVDDIMTTGATINECAIELKKAGANKIFVLTIAKTTNH